MNRIDIAGVYVHDADKKQAIQTVDSLVLAGGQPHLAVTVYSEFIVFAQKDPHYREALNSASLSLPDGIGVLWAAKFLSLPLTSVPVLRQIQALSQVVYTGASLVLSPGYCRTVIREQVTGSRLVWDIAKLCAERGYRLALVGGVDGVAQKAAEALQANYPNLQISLTVSDCRFDQDLVSRIAATNSDVLLIAYQPPKQELWLWGNLSKLNVKACFGLGGTFDYLAGKRPLVPHFLHYMGLEWLWRLVTQPWRAKRIWNAIPVFIWTVFRHKIGKSRPAA